MGFLKKLFGGGKETATESAPVTTQCPHTTLVPRWNTAEDMGKDDKISEYTCESCGSTFSAEEGRRLIAEEEQRLRAIEGDRAP